MRIEESRRITGRHLLLAGTGAAAELFFAPGDDEEALLAGIRGRAERLAERLGWEDAWLVVRRWPGGASIALPAPIDQMEPAASLLEWAATGEPTEEAVVAEAERKALPALRLLLGRTLARGVPAFYDDDGFTAGLGRHAETWPVSALPSVVDPATHGGIPFVYVTGTNGKTTTTRLLARIGREAGLVSGHTSSDGVVVQGEWVEKGDWTGPGAARMLFRRPEVELAVLETARGGLLRRGLVLDGAAAAIVTNISDDHLGEWGIDDLAAMAEAKLVVARAVTAGGRLIVGAEAGPLTSAVERLQADRPDLKVRRFSATGPADATVSEGWLVVQGRPLLPVREIPITLGGAAVYNVQNALAAALCAAELGLPDAAIVAALRGFRPSPEDSLGRTNLFSLGGAHVLLDFAHNPDGVRRIGELSRGLVATVAPGRRLVLVGLAGDRTDAIREAFVDEVLAIPPDLIALKELPEHWRGRAEGEMPALLRAAFEVRGFPSTQLLDVPDEREAAARLLDLAAPGDLVLLFVHEQVESVLALLRERGATPWQPTVAT